MPAPKNPAKRDLWISNLSKAHKGRPAWNKGRKMPLGFRLKMGEISLRFWNDPMNRDKIARRNAKVALAKIGDCNPAKRAEVKQKISKSRIRMGLARSDKNPSRLPEVREKIRRALMGHSVDSYVREKISKKLEGRFAGELNPFFGKRHSSEVKEKSRQRAIEMIASGLLSHRRTSIELKIREELERRNLKFIEQFPLETITVADFYLPENRIVIYCDGDYWHKGGWAEKHNIIRKDKWQTKVLADRGYKVFRFSEADIIDSPERCIEAVIQRIEEFSLGRSAL